MLIGEIEKAQQGLPYDENPSYDWADPGIELNYPDVTVHGLTIPMEDYKSLLKEWIEFNKKICR